ncbi:MBL fold metallo-hydrolase [bacterium]|nr:MBL fold metallo-hydrolase [bacterium]
MRITLRTVLLCLLLGFGWTEARAAVEVAASTSDSSRFSTAFRFRTYQDEQGKPRPNPAPEQIYGPLYSVGPVDVSVYLLKTAQGLVLFDSGYRGRDSSLVEDNVRKLGLDPQQIKEIFITHWHPDHSGGAARIAALSGAEVLLNKYDAEVVRTGLYRGKSVLTPCDRVKDIEDGQVFDLGDATVKVLYTPGQTRGEVVYLVTLDGPQGPCRALAAGDATGFKDDVEEFEQNKYPGICADYDRTVEILKSLQFDLYLGGHPHQVFNEMRADGFPFVTRGQWLKMVENRHQQKVVFLQAHPEYANY